MSIKNIILSLIILILASCAHKTYQPDYTPSSSQDDETSILMAERALVAKEPSPANQNELNQENTQRYVQFEAYITLNTSQPDSVHRQINMLAVKFNGYILHAENNSTVIRIPSEDFSKAIKIIETLGKVENKEIKGEDVTEQYYDLSTRLESNQKIKERYLDLLKLATNVESALKVERELERLNIEIDRLTGQLNRLKHLVRFSTISVYTGEKIKPGPIGYVFYGIYEAVKWLFVWD
jgi:hypothetical protein